VVERVAAMVPAGAAQGPVMFVGGVARNGCIRSLLQTRLGAELSVPDRPQIVSALGAALIAQQSESEAP
jgi:activator of 2-hydroxyglutaryl-CoA dehydratase